MRAGTAVISGALFSRIGTCLAAVFFAGLNGTRALRVCTTSLGDFGHRYSPSCDRASMQRGGLGFRAQGFGPLGLILHEQSFTSIGLWLGTKA